MCPAEVLCPDGYSFIVPKGHVLDTRISGFEHLPPEDQVDVRNWQAIFGTEKGYMIHYYGREGVELEVTPTTVVSCPTGYENQTKLEPGNVYHLKAGTQIIPVGQQK